TENQSSDTMSLTRQWRSDVMISHRSKKRVAPRTFAGLGILSPQPQAGLVKLNPLLLVAVYDEPIDRRRPAIRVIAYRPCQTLHGVNWASAENSVLYKDLALEPKCGSRGLVFDSQKQDLFQLALKLNSRISQAETRLRLRSRQSSSLQLPRLWAGFPQATHEALKISGPECEQIAERFGLSFQKLKKKFTRNHLGLHLLPLDWVSDSLMNSLQIFADLAEFPCTQVFSLFEFPNDLTGYQGAACYDFYASRFRAEHETRLLETSQGARNSSSGLAAC
ncbi:MAG: hypothetical protein RID07_14315, partial [Lacipirellulaceae bacterium]